MTYDSYRAVVDADLRAAFADRQGMLYDLLRYHLGWVDERGNPAADTPTRLHHCGVLSLAAADAVAGDHVPAAPAASAVELAYNFVLVHNDVQAGRIDQNDTRPSIWWVWGPSQAINAGDGLHALARSALMRLSDGGIPAGTVLEALRSLDRACLTLCEGQYMDLTYQDQLMVSESDYLDMIRRKSGALAGCSARIGALAAGADDETAGALYDWGEKLGMALQVRNDITDLWGEQGDGFTASNVLNKKKSLPLIHALHHAPTTAKRELGGIYMKRVLEPSDSARIVAILDDAGSRPYAEGYVERLLGDAHAAASSESVQLQRPEALQQATEWIIGGALV
ncbi:MAG: polyprenyl synthetase family protein [Chloroflexota bacterium]|nr:polyprenyl synthetase family protein [Chloroflexota bacterium]MDE2685808.1 polyprenyl synthetase family protein [Chloroflexota bacterium]